MKYILTGGSGFIGTHFTNNLQKDIYYNIDIDDPKVKNNHLKLDINDRKSLLNIKLDNDNNFALIHLAAVHFDFQKGYYETNVNGTKNILEFIEKNEIKTFVFFSSVAVYGNSENGKNEKSEKKPTNDYGKSKWQAEEIIRQWHKNNKYCKIIIVRPAVVFGEYNFGNVYNLITQIKSKMYAIIGSGKNIKSIAYAKNLVDSVMFALKNVNTNYFEFNYCDYPQLTTLELSNIISENLNYKKPLRIPLIVTKLISLPIDILEKILKRDLKFNSERIKKFTKFTYFASDKIRDLGFKPNYNMRESIKNTLNWIYSNDTNKLRKDWYSKAKKL